MIIEVPDIQQQLSRAFDINGGFQSTISASVSPVLIVGQGAPTPYSSDVPYTWGGQIAGDVSHEGLIMVVNPSTSSQWICIDRVGVGNFSSNAVQFGLQFGNGTGGTIESVYAPNGWLTPMDTRVVQLQPVKNIFFNTTSSPGAGSQIVSTLGAGQYTHIQLQIGPVVLAPNTGFFMSLAANGANTFAMMVNARIYEIRQK